MTQTKLSILLPVRDEGANIKLMLKILSSFLDVPHEIIVIYDTPDDNTIPVVQELLPKLQNVRLVHNTRGVGVANAILAGVEASHGDYILIFAADEVGPVIAIEDMMALMDEGCDLVSCTRYAHGGRRLGGSLIQGFLSRLGNRIFSFFSGSALTDATTGIKMFRRSLFDSIKIESGPAGWAVVFELAIKAQALGFKIGEVPIISVDRLYGGKSTFSLFPWFREYLRWFIWGLMHCHRIKTKPLIRIPTRKR